jgi:WhiB family redox-sensing transcriptional regulator
MGAMEWARDAACQYVSVSEVDVFHPDPEAPDYAEQVADAKELCSGCPAEADCLLYALAEGIEGGIWGGYTAEERAALMGAATDEETPCETETTSETSISVPPPREASPSPTGSSTTLPSASSTQTSDLSVSPSPNAMSSSCEVSARSIGSVTIAASSVTSVAVKRGSRRRRRGRRR